MDEEKKYINNSNSNIIINSSLGNLTNHITNINDNNINWNELKEAIDSVYSAYISKYNNEEDLKYLSQAKIDIENKNMLRLKSTLKKFPPMLKAFIESLSASVLANLITK